MSCRLARRWHGHSRSLHPQFLPPRYPGGRCGRLAKQLRPRRDCQLGTRRYGVKRPYQHIDDATPQLIKHHQPGIDTFGTPTRRLPKLIRTSTLLHQLIFFLSQRLCVRAPLIFRSDHIVAGSEGRCFCTHCRFTAIDTIPAGAGVRWSQVTLKIKGSQTPGRNKRYVGRYAGILQLQARKAITHGKRDSTHH
jgi:hypothetical protein